MTTLHDAVNSTVERIEALATERERARIVGVVHRIRPLNAAQEMYQARVLAAIDTTASEPADTPGVRLPPVDVEVRPAGSQAAVSACRLETR